MVRKKIAVALKIEDSCLNAGDHHHCLGMDGVWATQFGPTVYPVIEPHLKTMFESRSKHDYNKAFKAARERPAILTRPDLQDKLDKIKKRAPRYAGYIRRARQSVATEK